MGKSISSQTGLIPRSNMQNLRWSVISMSGDTKAGEHPYCKKAIFSEFLKAVAIHIAAFAGG